MAKFITASEKFEEIRNTDVNKVYVTPVKNSGIDSGIIGKNSEILFRAMVAKSKKAVNHIIVNGNDCYIIIDGKRYPLEIKTGRGELNSILDGTKKGYIAYCYRPNLDVDTPEQFIKQFYLVTIEDFIKVVTAYYGRKRRPIIEHKKSSDGRDVIAIKNLAENTRKSFLEFLFGYDKMYKVISYWDVNR